MYASGTEWEQLRSHVLHHTTYTYNEYPKYAICSRSDGGREATFHSIQWIFHRSQNGMNTHAGFSSSCVLSRGLPFMPSSFPLLAGTFHNRKLFAVLPSLVSSASVPELKQGFCRTLLILDISPRDPCFGLKEEVRMYASGRARVPLSRCGPIAQPLNRSVLLFVGY